MYISNTYIHDTGTPIQSGGIKQNFKGDLSMESIKAELIYWYPLYTA